MMAPDTATCDTRRMYFRSIARFDPVERCIVAPVPTRIEFHSYFNVFPTKHWNDYLTITQFDIVCSFIGTAEFQLYECRPEQAKPDMLRTVTVSSESVADIIVFTEIPLSNCSGYLYLVVNTLGADTKLFNFSAVCQAEAKKISLAVLSCTFRREEAVKQNIATVCGLFDRVPGLFEHSSYFVVDNDGGSSLTAPPHPQLEIIPNANLGGAGGFTRGIMRAMQEGFSHILLCDDDILLPAETLRRTMVILSLLRDENMGVHGAMLELERKTVLHEAGELFDMEKRLHVNMHYGKEMTNVRNIRAAMFESYGMVRVSNMFGWWFTAVPTRFFQDCGLPLPLFVSGDDLEYSLRTFKQGYRAFVTPTISIWHPSHMTQHAPLRMYFIMRNRLAYAPLHAPPKRVRQLLKVALKEAWLLALTKRYATALAVCQGVSDFLSGPQWMNENLEDWLKRLKYLDLEKAGKLYRDDWTVPVMPVYPDTRKRESFFWRSVRFLTMNGHILSGLFHKPAASITSPHHVSLAFGVAPLGRNLPKFTFRASSLLYYDPHALVGYHAVHDNAKFREVFFRLLQLRLKAFFVLSSVYESYRRTGREYTTVDWWKKRLGIC